MCKSLGRLSYLVKRQLLKVLGQLMSIFVHARKIPHQGKVCLFHTLKIGDSVVLTPAIKAFLNIKRYDCYIVCSPEGKNIFRGLVPDNKIIVYQPHKATMIDDLKAHKFDIIIDFHNSLMDLKRFFLPLHISHLYTFRAGFYTPWFFPWRYHHYIPWVSEIRHEVENYLGIPQRLGLQILDKSSYVPQNEHSRQNVQKRLHKHCEPHTPSQWIIIHAPALGRHKRWPSQKFIDLSEKILTHSSLGLIYTGIESEQHLIDPIFNALKSDRIINLCNQLSFAEFIEVIRLANLLISVDTCAIHIAYATKTPTIALFGPSNEKVWAPYNTAIQTVVHSHIECRPCDRNFQSNTSCAHVNCMEQIDVNIVYQEALTKLMV